MMTIEQIRAALADKNVQKVSKNTGLSPALIYRIKHGFDNPGVRSVKILSDYLEKK